MNESALVSEIEQLRQEKQQDREEILQQAEDIQSLTNLLQEKERQINEIEGIGFVSTNFFLIAH